MEEFKEKYSIKSKKEIKLEIKKELPIKSSYISESTKDNINNELEKNKGLSIKSSYDNEMKKDNIIINNNTQNDQIKNMNPFMNFGMNPMYLGNNPMNFGMNPMFYGMNPMNFGMMPMNLGMNLMNLGMNPMYFGMNPNLGMNPMYFGLNTNLGMNLNDFGMNPMIFHMNLLNLSGKFGLPFFTILPIYSFNFPMDDLNSKNINIDTENKESVNNQNENNPKGNDFIKLNFIILGFKLEINFQKNYTIEKIIIDVKNIISMSLKNAFLSPYYNFYFKYEGADLDQNSKEIIDNKLKDNSNIDVILL